MALIEERNPGRSDGGYTRVFGDQELGALISQLHATSIAAGNELEKLVEESHSVVMSEEDLDAFEKGWLLGGTYLAPKKVIKIIKKRIGTDKEPDFLIIVIFDRDVYVVELKDGDTFDTKKSAGEIKSLREFSRKLDDYIKAKNLKYTVRIRFCSFNQDDRDAIVKGLKSEITKEEAWSGKDLCNVLGISYQNLIKRREIDQARNLKYFIKSLVKIAPVEALILEELRNKHRMTEE